MRRIITYLGSPYSALGFLKVSQSVHSGGFIRNRYLSNMMKPTWTNRKIVIRPENRSPLSELRVSPVA